jgi:hypothetical protein
MMMKVFSEIQLCGNRGVNWEKGGQTSSACVVEDCKMISVRDIVFSLFFVDRCLMDKLKGGSRIHVFKGEKIYLVKFNFVEKGGGVNREKGGPDVE